MTAIRVIGIGSPFGSDRIGWDALDRLTSGLDTSEVSFISLDRPGASLLEYMQDVKTVVLVDAVKAGLEPGSLVRLKEDQIECSNSVNSTHGFGVAEAIALGRELGNLPEKLVLFGLETGDDPEWMPSSRSIDELKELITTEIAVCLGETIRVN